MYSMEILTLTAGYCVDFAVKNHSEEPVSGRNTYSVARCVAVN